MTIKMNEDAAVKENSKLEPNIAEKKKKKKAKKKSGKKDKIKKDDGKKSFGDEAKEVKKKKKLAPVIAPESISWTRQPIRRRLSSITIPKALLTEEDLSFLDDDPLDVTPKEEKEKPKKSKPIPVIAPDAIEFPAETGLYREISTITIPRALMSKEEKKASKESSTEKSKKSSKKKKTIPVIAPDEIEIDPPSFDRGVSAITLPKALGNLDEDFDEDHQNEKRLDGLPEELGLHRRPDMSVPKWLNVLKEIKDD